MKHSGLVSRLLGKNSIEVVEKPLPEISEDGMLIEIGLAGICGTDIHIIENADRPEWRARLPFTLGHEISGRILKLGRKAPELMRCDARLEEGDRIAFYAFLPCGNCWWERRFGTTHTLVCTQPNPGYFQNPEEWPYFTAGWGEYLYIQPESWVWKVPEHMSYEEIVLTEPFSMGIRAVQKAISLPAWKNLEMLSFGGTVVVLGSGAIGILTAIAAKIAGAGQVIMVGGPKKNLETAQKVGAIDVFYNIDEISAEERIEKVKKLTEGGVGADVVFEAAGVPPAFLEGLEMVRKLGTFVELGCLIDDSSTVPLNVSRHIVKKDITLHGVSNQPPQDFTKALNCLQQFKSTFGFSQIVTEVYALTDFENALANMKDPENKGIKVAFKGKAYE